MKKAAMRNSAKSSNETLSFLEKVVEKQTILNSPFDIETHKKTFINYLEVVISPDGIIEYGVPSHNAKLEQILRAKGVDPVLDCPKEYYASYNAWLCRETGYIMVWGLPNSFIVGMPNKKQQEALDLLKKEGLL